MKNLYRLISISGKLLPFFFAATLTAQTPEPAPLTFSGYAEVYYAYDFGKPGNHERPRFFYAYNRHNEVNLNLGFLKANYAKDRV